MSFDLGEAPGDTRRGVRVLLGLVERDRLLEQPGGILGPSRERRELPGPAEELRPSARVIRQRGRLLEVALRLGRRAERGRPFAGADERRARPLR